MSLAAPAPTRRKEIATLAGGCFWCLEAVFDELKGVESVESGYMGGQTRNPTYQQVCNGDTGHAEVVRVTFDPSVLSFDELLEVFFVIHDPTTLNYQGNDFGTQYRSAIFYHTPEQKAAAERVIGKLNAAKLWNAPIVTEVAPAAEYYPGEGYHQEILRPQSQPALLPGGRGAQSAKISEAFPGEAQAPGVTGERPRRVFERKPACAGHRGGASGAAREQRARETQESVARLRRIPLW